MKTRNMIIILIAILALTLLTGCGKTEPAEEPSEKLDVAVIEDPSTRPTEEKSLKIFTVDPNAPVEIPDESVPLASTFERGEQITRREAEAIAIAHAGFNHDQVSYLYSKLLEDAEIPCYQVQFRSNDVPYSILVDAATGEVLPS